METHGIKFKDKFGYALGDMGGILSFSLVSSYLTMFYTDILGISAASITILMLVARIWDAVNDPMWGSFIDSRKPTKHGRFRPYILGASFPLAVGAFLMFFKIPGLSNSQYLIYAYITYIFYGMMYTGVNIPYGSLASAITDDEVERSSLSMWRSVGAGIGGLPAQILMPLVVFTTVINADGSSSKVLDGNKLSLCVGAISVLTIVLFIIHFRLTKERIQLPPTQKTSDYNLLKTIKVLAKNKPFVVYLCFLSVFKCTHKRFIIIFSKITLRSRVFTALLPYAPICLWRCFYRLWVSLSENSAKRKFAAQAWALPLSSAH